MMNRDLLSIPLPLKDKSHILEDIKKYITSHNSFTHITSLNPEIFVILQSDQKFKRIVETSQIKIIDGVGVVLAGHLLGIDRLYRITGVEMLEALLEGGGSMRSTAILIGGKGNLAERVAECYSQLYPGSKFVGIEGYKDVLNPTPEEEKRVKSIVTNLRPHIVIVSFGSPYQEKWIWDHKSWFSDSICMGVGGGLDFVGKRIARAPRWLRLVGLEWFFRLMIQPWRIKRQTRLIKFIGLVILQKIGLYKPLPSISISDE